MLHLLIKINLKYFIVFFLEKFDDKNFNLLRHHQYVLCCALFHALFCFLLADIKYYCASEILAAR